MHPEMMKSRKVRMVLLVLLVVILLVAWIDGGREPQRMIEQPVDLPATANGGGAGQ
jgi:predicted alpha/beta hydrolase